MKKLSCLLACLAFVIYIKGQGFSKAEYFFDIDPGQNNGTAIPLSGTSDTVNFTASIPTTSLSNGFHHLGIRVKHNDGKWSFFETRRFYISSPSSPDVTNVVAAEYFIDTEPGVGNGMSLAIGPSGAIVNFVASIPTSVTAGFHYLAVRTKDADGKWGMFESRRFYISSPSSPDVTNVVAAEYYIDADPGVGNGTSLAIGASGSTISFLASIPTSLSPGFHFLSIRSKDADGKWGMFESRRFYISSPSLPDVTNVVGAEYYIDTDPGVGNGTSLSIGPSGSTVSFLASIPTSLSSGFHFLSIRTKDANGKWGMFESRRFYVQQPPNADMQIITNAEIFVDADPGVGNGFPVTLPTTGNIVNLTSMLAPCLTTGQHFISLRMKDANGKWGLFDYDTLTILPGIVKSAIAPPGPLSKCTLDVITLTTPPILNMAYLWKLNGNNLSGATGTSYNVTGAAGGNYTVQTTCLANNTVSAAVVVGVKPDVVTGTVTGDDSIYNGQTSTYLSTGMSGGKWITSNSNATAGLLTGQLSSLALGNTDMIYTIDTGCASPVSSSKNVIISPMRLHLKTFIEGFYDANGLMRPVLGTTCDTIILSLATSSNPHNIVSTNTTVMDVDGISLALFADHIPDASYYLVFKHRNAMETWSANPLPISLNTNYDFTSALSQAYGNNMIETSDQMGWAIFSGDISDVTLGVGFQDGIIESQDYGDMEGAIYFSLLGYQVQDITGDGVVESADYGLMENNVYFTRHAIRP